MKRFKIVILLANALFVAACSSDTPTSNTKPAAPTNVAALCGNQKITLSWSAVTGAVSYNVNRASTSGGTSTVAGNTASVTYVDATGTVGSQYFYTITAVNAAGTSVASSEVSETVCRLMGGALQARVLTFTSANATVSTFAGSSGFSGLVDGTGSVARFSQPQGMTTDGNFLYVADYVNNAIRKIDPATSCAAPARPDMRVRIRGGCRRPLVHLLRRLPMSPVLSVTSPRLLTHSAFANLLDGGRKSVLSRTESTKQSRLRY